MRYRTLGRSGLSVSALGIGCWAIGGETWRDGEPCGWSGVDDAESVKALQAALDMGVNFFDTADVYGCGHSERLIAQAVKGRRGQVVIATKFGFPFDEENRSAHGARYDRNYIISACEDSLRRLDTEYIDLYQFHLWNSDAGDEVMETLEKLVAAGKIRYYGWSTDSPERAAVFARGEHCAAIQQTMNIFEGDFATLRICEQNHLASINRKPLGMGILTGKYSRSSSFAAGDIRSVWNLAADEHGGQIEKLADIRGILTEDGRSLAQGALAWIWAKSTATIPIPGFKTVKQVEENIGALRFAPFSKEKLEQIDRIIGR